MLRALTAATTRTAMLARLQAQRRLSHGDPRGLMDLFNSDVYTGQGLSGDVAQAYQKVLKGNATLEGGDADVMAQALMGWATAKGVQTYRHFFHPMGFNFTTSGLNKDFLAFDFSAGKPVGKFSGSSLLRGETDGSSFPNGGLRATHSAAGYTLWDGVTPPFIREDVLYIPSVFFAWTGDALDEKIPVLRSTAALSRQAMRLLRLIGDKRTTSVHTSVGCEQEFFLIERSKFNQRIDLRTVGRTVVGAAPIRGQQMEDHYFGRIPPRVRKFFTELKQHAWRMGIPMETSHNEVAPGQFEVAPIFSRSSVALDMNQMLMQLIEETAAENGLAALLHEKPFSGINGSGKHNNWSIDTDTGINLFKPGKTAEEQRRFMLFIAAVVTGFARNSDLIRLAIAVPGNDHRLGACEAPPGIMSVYTGHQLGEHIDSVINGGALAGYQGATVQRDINVEPYGPLSLPVEDRNRTSPFPFVGNRFEFRAVGSSQSVGLPQTMLAVAAADGCRYLADDIEARIAKGSSAEEAVNTAVRDAFKKHQSIIFNGNGYSADWPKQAAARGLLNIDNSVDAIMHYDSEKNVKLLDELRVLRPHEVHARKEVMLEHYVRTIVMEAKCAVQIAVQDALPAVSRAAQLLGEPIKAAADIKSAVADLQSKLATVASLHSDKGAVLCRDGIVPSMVNLRKAVDAAEVQVPHGLWHLPSYEQLVHSAKF